MGKMMFFVIPEMPCKTFVMLKKKLPDHFNKALISTILCEQIRTTVEILLFSSTFSTSVEGSV